MSPEYFKVLYEYNSWANREVWRCSLHLSDEQLYARLDYSVGSVFNHLIHTMAVEYWWLHFLRTGELDFLNADDFTTRDQIRTKWDVIDMTNHGYIATLTPQELERLVRPDDWDTDAKPVPLWQPLLQVAMHSLDHRSQTLRALYDFGAPTIEQDFIYYILAKQQLL